MVRTAEKESAPSQAAKADDEPSEVENHVANAVPAIEISESKEEPVPDEEYATVKVGNCSNLMVIYRYVLVRQKK